MRPKRKKENKFKKIVSIIFFVLLVTLLVYLLILSKDSKKIEEVSSFIKADTKVLYIVKNKKIEESIEILKKYDIEYLLINSKELNLFERKKLRNLVDVNKLNNILIIYKNGKRVDMIVNHQKSDDIIEFLQKNEIIPKKIVSNVKEIKEESLNLLNNTYAMIYLPYKELDEIDSQDEIFKQISEKYNIEYKKIDAYLLSDSQKEKINSLLGISLVEDQILILIKDNKMIANIRGIHRKNTYVEKLYDVNFIDELELKINEIDYEEFDAKLESKEKNIILIGSRDIKDSNEVFNLLNQMIYNYNIEVDYININKKDNDKYNKIKEKIEKKGYSGGFSLPIVIIVESDNILDYAIGNSKEEYFIDIFIENGVIKGDVINEK